MVQRVHRIGAESHGIAPSTAESHSGRRAARWRSTASGPPRAAAAPHSASAATAGTSRRHPVSIRIDFALAAESPGAGEAEHYRGGARTSAIIALNGWGTCSGIQVEAAEPRSIHQVCAAAIRGADGAEQLGPL